MDEYISKLQLHQQGWSLASWDKEVLSSVGLFRKHEGKSFHIQSKWKSIRFVGTLQESKEDQWKEIEVEKVQEVF